MPTLFGLVANEVLYFSGLVVPLPFQSWQSVANLAIPGGNLPVTERMPFAPARDSQLSGAAAITPSESTAFDLVEAGRRRPAPQKTMAGLRGREIYEIVHNFTNPCGGEFPDGVAPKTIYAQILRSSVLPNWTRNQLQVELYRGSKLGRYVRLGPALYSTTENWAKMTCTRVESSSKCRTSMSPDKSIAASSKRSVGGEAPQLTKRESNRRNSYRGTAEQPSESATMPTPFKHDRKNLRRKEENELAEQMGCVDSFVNSLPSSSKRALLAEDRFGLPSLKSDPVIRTAGQTNVRQWSASQVRQFVAKLGFAGEAIAFEKESVDGESLLLLKRSHFVNRLGISLGPALCIFRRINALRAVADEGPVVDYKSSMQFWNATPTTGCSSFKPRAFNSLPGSCITGNHDLALSFCGCGFLGLYHCGAARCLKAHGSKVLARCKRYAGASAGALVAALLLSSTENVEIAANLVLGLAEEVRSLKYGLLTKEFSLAQRVYDEMSRLLPPDAHEIVTNRLFISMTDRDTLKPRLESRFETREKLLKCLVASSYIPFFSGIHETPPVIEGCRYIDGGICLNLPVFPDLRTITISPFHSSDADVSPIDDKLTFDWGFTVGKQRLQFSYNNFVRGKQALVPPTDEILREYLERGFIDMMIFLKKNDVFERLNGTEA
uniref:PNPLA domain-containing protein n=1 Tax=Trichuris muris TaxID=70415 RepID=A0A5S6QX15_TRIMR